MCHWEVCHCAEQQVVLIGRRVTFVAETKVATSLALIDNQSRLGLCAILGEATLPKSVA